MVKIYSLGAGTAIEQNGTIQVVPRGTIEASTAGNKIQLNRIGLGSITGLQDFWEYTDADGSPLGGDIDETLEALSYFFFSPVVEIPFSTTIPAGAPPKQLYKVPLREGQAVRLEFNGWLKSASYLGARTYFTSAYKFENGAIIDSGTTTLISGNAPLQGFPFIIIGTDLFLYAPSLALEDVEWSITLKMQY